MQSVVSFSFSVFRSRITVFIFEYFYSKFFLILKIILPHCNDFRLLILGCCLMPVIQMFQAVPRHSVLQNIISFFFLFRGLATLTSPTMAGFKLCPYAFGSRETILALSLKWIKPEQHCRICFICRHCLCVHHQCTN